MPASPGATAPPAVHQSSAAALRFQRCAWCATALFGARCFCPCCGSEDLRWEHSKGTGRVHSYAERPRRGNPPRLIVHVELAEGFQMEARLLNLDTCVPVTGAAVRFERYTDAGLPAFRVTASEAAR